MLTPVRLKCEGQGDGPAHPPRPPTGRMHCWGEEKHVLLRALLALARPEAARLPSRKGNEEIPAPPCLSPRPRLAFGCTLPADGSPGHWSAGFLGSWALEHGQTGSPGSSTGGAGIRSLSGHQKADPGSKAWELPPVWRMKGKGRGMQSAVCNVTKCPGYHARADHLPPPACSLPSTVAACHVQSPRKLLGAPPFQHIQEHSGEKTPL